MNGKEFKELKICTIRSFLFEIVRLVFRNLGLTHILQEKREREKRRISFREVFLL